MFEHTRSGNTAPTAAPSLISDTFRDSGQELTLMAHQGWQGEVPSNSLAAITKSFDRAESVEFDVYGIQDQDGKTHVVCCHPESYFLYVDRGGMKNTENLPLTFEESQSLTKDGVQLIPSLKQVLDSWRGSQQLTELQIELKGSGVAGAVVPFLQKYFTENDIDQTKIMLTGLCYPGDRSRIEVVRELDRNIRLALPLRGGDFQQDGFQNLDDVIDFAHRNRISMITIHRKNLTTEIVNRLKAEGFQTGTFHGRTSDEVEAAISLGVTYVAADMMNGPRLSDYPNVRQQGTPFYSAFLDSGFYTMRDWIWETGWKFEALSREMTPSATFGSASTGVDAALRINSDSVLLQLFDAKQGQLTEGMVDFSRVEYPREYLGNCDLNLCDSQTGLQLGKFLSKDGQIESFRSVINHVLPRVFAEPTEIDSVKQLVSGLTFENFVAISEGQASTALAEAVIELSPNQFTFVEEASRQFLFRTGRVIGMLGFTALNPRHGLKEEHNLVISSSLASKSRWVKTAASEQIQAQMLRSGKFRIDVKFTSSEIN